MPNRGFKIPEDIRKLINSFAIKVPNKPRAELAAELQELIENKGLKPPQEETLMRMISAARNKQLSPKDSIWHLGTLREHPISKEAIPAILEVQRFIEESRFPQYLPPLTVRQAYWISCLYKVVKDTPYLYWTAEHYALYEKICEITEIDFESSLLDKELLKHPRQLDETLRKLVSETPEEAWKKIINKEFQKDVNNERTHNKKR
jgi:hypothetical protein